MAHCIRYTEQVHCTVLSGPFDSCPSLPNTTVPTLKGIISILYVHCIAHDKLWFITFMHYLCITGFYSHSVETLTKIRNGLLN